MVQKQTRSFHFPSSREVLDLDRRSNWLDFPQIDGEHLILNPRLIEFRGGHGFRVPGMQCSFLLKRSYTPLDNLQELPLILTLSSDVAHDRSWKYWVPGLSLMTGRE